MFTIFSCPKPFLGDIKEAQINAIKSWMLLNPAPEIILIGNEIGVPEFCKEFNIRNIPEVRKNQLGTPFVDSIFEIGQREASNQVVCYLNSDLIVMQDFGLIFENIYKYPKNFIILGRRWDFETGAIDFSSEWRQRLSLELKEKGAIHHYGSDYFIFPKGLIYYVPQFVIGRGIWDNWLIYFSVCNNFHIIDATEITQVIHQNHDYSHVKNINTGSWRDGEEAKNNIMLDSRVSIFDVDNANYRLTKNGIKFSFFTSLLNFFSKVYLKLLFGGKLISVLRLINHILIKRRLKDYFKGIEKEWQCF